MIIYLQHIGIYLDYTMCITKNICSVNMEYIGNIWNVLIASKKYFQEHVLVKYNHTYLKHIGTYLEDTHLHQKNIFQSFYH